VPVQVAVLDDYQELARHFGPWEQLGLDVELTVFHDHISNDGVVRDLLADFEVIVAMRERTPFTSKRLSSLPNLKLLVTTGMANASIDMDAAAALDITVCGTGALAAPTVELTWGLIIALARHIVEEDRQVRDGLWQHTIGPELAGRTLGIVGFGRLGKRVAEVAQAFEMNVIAWSQNLDPADAAAAGVEAVVKDALFERSDVLSLHVRLIRDTSGIVGAADLARMKPTALIVNTSRAEIIAPGALLDALRKGRPGYAAVDVYEQEPIVNGNHPFLSMPNVLCTPHLGWAEWQNFELYFRETFEQIVAFEQGQPLRLRNPDVRRRPAG
jgi:phosphoglycerate dehydrogenase-like enzyme